MPGVGKKKPIRQQEDIKMAFRAFAKKICNCINVVLEKFDLTLQKGSNNFITDCCYLPYEVEYESSPDNIEKMLEHTASIWGGYGQNETYWSVLTSDSYLEKNLDKNNIDKFYDTGKDMMLQIENSLRRCGEWGNISFQDCMEYGCGVGRVTMQLSKIFTNVTGLDISAGHLELAKQRMDCVGIKNVCFQKIESLHELKQLPKYDFIYSIIVLQHNPPPVIAIIIDTFFKLLKVNGIVMFQVPVQIKDYSFSVSDYLANMEKYDSMEMHMLPQDKILKIGRENNCYLLECHNDGWVGQPNIMVSQTFLFKKSDGKIHN